MLALILIECDCKRYCEVDRNWCSLAEGCTIVVVVELVAEFVVSSIRLDLMRGNLGAKVNLIDAHFYEILISLSLNSWHKRL